MRALTLALAIVSFLFFVGIAEATVCTYRSQELTFLGVTTYQGTYIVSAYYSDYVKYTWFELRNLTHLPWKIYVSQPISLAFDYMTYKPDLTCGYSYTGFLDSGFSGSVYFNGQRIGHYTMVTASSGTSIYFVYYVDEKEIQLTGAEKFIMTINGIWIYDPSVCAYSFKGFNRATGLSSSTTSVIVPKLFLGDSTARLRFGYSASTTESYYYSSKFNYSYIFDGTYLILTVNNNGLSRIMIKYGNITEIINPGLFKTIQTQEINDLFVYEYPSEAYLTKIELTKHECLKFNTTKVKFQFKDTNGRFIPVRYSIQNLTNERVANEGLDEFEVFSNQLYQKYNITINPFYLNLPITQTITLFDFNDIKLPVYTYQTKIKVQYRDLIGNVFPMSFTVNLEGSACPFKNSTCIAYSFQGGGFESKLFQFPAGSYNLTLRSSVAG
ncbi:MAG: hypothetical protein ACK40U_04720, partial [Fervidobacterium pennivorans]